MPLSGHRVPGLNSKLAMPVKVDSDDLLAYYAATWNGVRVCLLNDIKFTGKLRFIVLAIRRLNGEEELLLLDVWSLSFAPLVIALERLFQNPGILKVGFGLRKILADIRISLTGRDDSAIGSEIVSFLDLHSVYQYLPNDGQHCLLPSEEALADDVTYALALQLVIRQRLGIEMSIGDLCCVTYGQSPGPLPHIVFLSRVLYALLEDAMSRLQYQSRGLPKSVLNAALMPAIYKGPGFQQRSRLSSGWSSGSSSDGAYDVVEDLWRALPKPVMQDTGIATFHKSGLPPPLNTGMQYDRVSAPPRPGPPAAAAVNHDDAGGQSTNRGARRRGRRVCLDLTSSNGGSQGISV
eukprot:jgi/Botrbrau1/1549/Bobra.0107s0037.1